MGARTEQQKETRRIFDRTPYGRELKRRQAMKYRVGNKVKIEVHRKIYDKTPAAQHLSALRVLRWQKKDEKRYKNSFKASNRRAYLKRKAEVLNHYGNGQCKVCLKRTLAFLSIDHVGNDGFKHRKETKCGSGDRFYAWLKRNGLPSEPPLQVLCMNCQVIKRHQARAMLTKRQIHNCKYRDRLKIEILNKYGGCRCVACDIREVACLSLDHIFDDGAAHRRSMGGGNAYQFGGNTYRWLKRNNFPNDPPLQVLCMNCQFLKINRILDGFYGGCDFENKDAVNEAGGFNVCKIEGF